MDKISAIMQAILNLIRNLLKALGAINDEDYDKVGAIGDEVVKFGDGVEALSES